MKSNQTIILKDLVLIGGGHSHVAVLKKFGMNPVPGVRLTVIARDVHTPYSGMLPGYVAGHYSFDEAHIDLRPLCRFAGAGLYHDEAVHIDPVNRQVLCTTRPPVAFDVLSINVGSRPQFQGVDGGGQFATPVKPINRFVHKWQQLEARVRAQPGPHRIGVVGAGAAGVEMVLATQFRLQAMLTADGRNGEAIECHLISRSPRILPRFPAAVATRFMRVLQARGVHVHTRLEATAVETGKLTLSDGSILTLDEVLLVTGASAPDWLRQSGLAVDDNGFVMVDDCLRSISNEAIFAAGDVAVMVNYPREKAGVYAVRQGPPLADNLRRAVLGQTLKPFRPQQAALALISTGDQYAVAARSGLAVEGRAVWRWKDWIDRRWMKKYSDLPTMTKNMQVSADRNLSHLEDWDETDAVQMRCGGCGAKVGADVLRRVLVSLQTISRNDVVIGLGDADDAAVVEMAAGKLMVHTVDHFRSFIDDPYMFGKITANHALSDIFAMGAEAQTALAIVSVPYGIEAKVEDTIRQLMIGAIEVLNAAGVALVGGHTSEAAELSLGFAINGFTEREHLLRKGGMKTGDVLVLTKPLGTGTLFAADMQHKAKGRWIEAALASMVLSNQAAAHCIFEHGARACTDVTGFGLLGHLLEMTRNSALGVKLDMNSLPVLDGAQETAEAGMLSSLHASNRRSEHAIVNAAAGLQHRCYPLIFDPQTSGGLLAALPADNVEACLAELRTLGYAHAAMIGEFTARNDRPESVTLICSPLA